VKLSTTQATLKTTPAEETQQGSPNLPAATITGDLNVRLEKAMRRAELLGYAAAGLAAAILAFIVVIAFV
jgi:hypothetical protein